MNLLRKLLWPFVPFYYLGALLNKKMYDWNVKKSTTYHFPLITVGNLSVGGTGKSPMVAYIVALLQDKFTVATLSRGYKRKLSGFQIVTQQSTALAIGDEPLQFKLNFPEVTVAVDADRANGIAKLFQYNKSIETIVLDDAFQHRKVQAGMQILLTAYNNLYVNDTLLPAGDLREPISAAKRASIIVVTKCPVNLSTAEREKIKKALRPQKQQKVFFSYINYATKVKGAKFEMELEDYLKHEFTLVTGIANPKPLLKYLEGKQAKFTHISFSDHHNFSAKEVLDLSKEKRLLTTEKDFMRLCPNVSLQSKLMYLPIKSCFLTEADRFDNTLLEYVKGNIS